MKEFLMCPPQFFGVEYEINPWMNCQVAVNRQLASQQWQTLRDTYLSLGRRIHEVDPAPGWPDMVFTANAGLAIRSGQALVASFRHPERQGEEPHYKRWFNEHGWAVKQLDTPFEGQGEVFPWQDQILFSHGFRSSLQAAQDLNTELGKKVICLQLTNPKFYHLDMALAPIPQAKIIVYYPQAFSADSVAKIKSLKADFIEINQHDVEAFGANLVAIDETIIMGAGTQKLAHHLRQKGLKVIELDMSEFRKAGGGVKCLTLELN